MNYFFLTFFRSKVLQMSEVPLSFVDCLFFHCGNKSNKHIITIETRKKILYYF